MVYISFYDFQLNCAELMTDKKDEFARACNWLRVPKEQRHQTGCIYWANLNRQQFIDTFCWKKITRLKLGNGPECYAQVKKDLIERGQNGKMR